MPWSPDNLRCCLAQLLDARGRNNLHFSPVISRCSLVESRCDSLQKVLPSAPRYLICQARLVASAPVRFPSPEERLVSAPANSQSPDSKLRRVLLEAD